MVFLALVELNIQRKHLTRNNPLLVFPLRCFHHLCKTVVNYTRYLQIDLIYQSQSNLHQFFQCEEKDQVLHLLDQLVFDKPP